MTETEGAADSLIIASARLGGSHEAYVRAVASTSFIGECASCVRPQRIEDKDVAHKHVKIRRPCVDCGNPVTLERVYVKKTGTACDSSCMAARGPSCSCGCGGMNHGRRWGNEEVVTGETTASRIQKYRDEYTRKQEAREAAYRRANEKKREALSEWLEQYWELVESIEGLKDWDSHIYSLWFRINHSLEPLQQNEIDWFCSSLMEEATARREKARLIEEKRVAAVYLGGVGEEIDATGTVTRIRWCEGRHRGYRLVVVESGNATVCFFSSRKFVWNLEEGQQVRVTGVVDEHKEYENVKQTKISSAFATVLE